MLYGIGLPRTGGQTLAVALSILTKKNVYHSIAGERWNSSIAAGDAGAVECYAPITWLNATDYGPHCFIHNIRDKESWLESCIKVYPRSQAENWFHPLWRYALSQFSSYYDDWHERIQYQAPNAKIINLIEKPRWDELCKILHYPIPSVPFPNKDFTRPSSPPLSTRKPRLTTPDPFSFF